MKWRKSNKNKKTGPESMWYLSFFLSDSNNLFFNHFRKSAATGLSLFKYTTTNTTDETRETNHRYVRQTPTHLPVFNYSWQYFSVSFTKKQQQTQYLDLGNIIYGFWKWFLRASAHASTHTQLQSLSCRNTSLSKVNVSGRSGWYKYQLKHKTHTSLDSCFSTRAALSLWNCF